MIIFLISIFLGILPIVNQEISIILASLLIYTSSGTIIYISQAKTKILTPTSIFFIFFTLFIYIGSLILYLRVDFAPILLLSTLGILTFSLGVLSSSSLLKFNQKNIISFFNTKIIHSYKGIIFNILLLMSILFSFMLSFLYFYKYGIPYLSQNVELTRLESVRAGGFLFHGFTLIFLFLISLVMIRAYSNRTIGLKMLEFSLIIVAFSLFFMTGFRSLLAMLIVLFILTRQQMIGRLEIRKLIFLSLIFIILFTFITWGRYSYGFENRDISDLPLYMYKAIEGRILLNNPKNIQFILEFIPSQHDYLYGYSYIMDLKAIKPGPDIAFGGWLTSYQTPHLAGIAGMTPTVIGEFYANFGVLGVVFGMFIVGFILQYIYIQIIRRSKNESSLLLLSLTTLFSAWMVMGGLGSIIFSNIIPILILLYLFKLSNVKFVKKEKIYGRS